ncbi:hypothetical protein BRD17_02855 [Halobacteriales archaeon SW_7_68_16]|nr:MAG: hypothetical protein BRD17_02855 [Halobacteriales archaeon SW_7_68_16]
MSERSFVSDFADETTPIRAGTLGGVVVVLVQTIRMILQNPGDGAGVFDVFPLDPATAALYAVPSLLIGIGVYELATRSGDINAGLHGEVVSMLCVSAFTTTQVVVLIGVPTAVGLMVADLGVTGMVAVGAVIAALSITTPLLIVAAWISLLVYAIPAVLGYLAAAVVADVRDRRTTATDSD